jgi:O-antigen/teichoic acid export membrane protein
MTSEGVVRSQLTPSGPEPVSAITPGGRHAAVSGAALVAGRIASMGLGFVAWLIAARLFSPAEVGIASSLVSGMMLCVQLALVGIGSALIVHYPRHADAPGRLLATALRSVAATSLVVAVAFVAVLVATSQELRPVVLMPSIAVAFVALTAFGTLNTLVDHVSIAIRRGDQVLLRNTVFGVVTVIGLFVIPATVDMTGSLAIVLAWVAAGAAACALAAVQLWRSTIGAGGDRGYDRALARRLVATGVPNWMLTLTERAPALVMPILVTEFFSPTTAAFWYAVWMMGWVVMIVPISMGQTLLAEIARHPDHVRRTTGAAIRGSLLLGAAGALAMAILAGFALSFLGRAYADAGQVALRVLLISVLPVTVIQGYYAVCRARGALREAVLVGAAVGAVSVAAALVSGSASGLVGMAAAWVIVQSAAAVWAAIRIRALV